jgi:hypothetical protein
MRRRADEFSREFGVPIAFMTVRGDPFTELRRVADEIRASAVVVGASAHAGHRLVGSLAVRLVKAARGRLPCPEPASGIFGSSPAGGAVQVPPGLLGLHVARGGWGCPAWPADRTVGRAEECGPNVGKDRA